MPPSIPNTSGRPSSLPQQIPPQVARLGTVDAAGNVTMDINWWLFLYNIAHQTLSAPGTPVPVPPVYNIAVFDSQDVDPVDATQSPRMIANAVQLESQDADLPSADLAALSLRINNGAQIAQVDSDVAAVDAIIDKRSIINALAWLLTERDINPLVQLSADVTGVLALVHGGTGDGVNFSWTGSTKTLVANTVKADGTSALTLSASGNSIQVSLQTSAVAGSNTGLIAMASGGASAGGSSGNIQAQSGSVSSGAGTSGNVSFTSGATQSGASGVISFSTGASTSGATGAITLTTGGTAAVPGGITISVGLSTASAAAQNDVTIFAGASTGTGASGATRLQSAGGGAGTDVVTVTDSGPSGSYAAELGFYAVTPIVRPTTAGAAAAFTQNAGNAVNDASTFDGYTIKQVVKALRNLGLLT